MRQLSKLSILLASGRHSKAWNSLLDHSQRQTLHRPMCISVDWKLRTCLMPLIGYYTGQETDSGGHKLEALSFTQSEFISSLRKVLPCWNAACLRCHRRTCHPRTPKSRP